MNDEIYPYDSSACEADMKSIKNDRPIIIHYSCIWAEQADHPRVDTPLDRIVFNLKDKQI